MNARYTPGERAAAIGPRLVVMAAGERAADMSALLDGAPTPLGVLSSLSGGDVARLPEFAAVVADGDDLVVMVRGDYRIGHAGEEWSGVDVATWREHRVADSDEDVVIQHGESAGELALPVSAGVVLASRVTWRPGAAEAAGPAAAGAAAPATPAPAADVPPSLAGGTDGLPPVPDPTPTPPAPAPVAPDPDSTLAEADDGFDETVGATIQGQRVPDEPAPAPPGEDAEPAPGDHDGRTITAEQMQKLRAQRATGASATAAPQVSATLAMSDGESVDLAQPVIIGRSPRAAQMSSAQLPRLVVVDDPYVSGTHLEVAVEDGAVVAVDRSTNGTTLTRPGRDPERLVKDEATVLGDGCVLGLSDDVTATVAVRGADT